MWKVGSYPEDATCPPGKARRSAWHLTQVGWWWVAIVGVFLGIGFGKGINLLVLLAYCMGVIFLLNVLRAGKQTRRLRMHYRLPDLVFARSPCRIEVDICND